MIVSDRKSVDKSGKRCYTHKLRITSYSQLCNNTRSNSHTHRLKFGDCAIFHRIEKQQTPLLFSRGKTKENIYKRERERGGNLCYIVVTSGSVELFSLSSSWTDRYNPMERHEPYRNVAQVPDN